MKKNQLTDRYDGRTLEQERKEVANRNQSRFTGIDFFDTTENGLIKTVSIKNTAAKAKRIAVFPGNLISVKEIEDIAGTTVDAIAAEGTKDDVTVDCRGLAHAQRHFQRNPTRVTEIQVSSSNELQFSQPIEIFKLSTFRKLGSEMLSPKIYRRSSDNLSLVSIPIKNGLQLDDQTCWIVTVAPNSDVDLSFFTGAVRNDAFLLKEAGRRMN